MNFVNWARWTSIPPRRANPTTAIATAAVFPTRFPDPPPRESNRRMPDVRLVSAGTADEKPPVAEMSALPTEY